MILRMGRMGAVWSFVVVWLLMAGCGGTQQRTERGKGYLVTFYSVPKIIRVGETQVAFRIQDRDYRIVSMDHVSLNVLDQAAQQVEAVSLKTGQGRDWRGWIDIPRPGVYQIVLTFSNVNMESESVRFQIDVPEKR